MGKNRVIIGLGGTGTAIVSAASKRTSLDDAKLFSIDSVTSSISLDNINRIKCIPIISDDKCGSGRDRERGAAMFNYHDEQGNFDELYAIAREAKTPVVVVSSAAGGTGSGSIVPFCARLIKKGINIIPIIVCPALDDPDAYHLNTNDLFIELDEIGVETYNVFRNRSGDSSYHKINNEIVDLIEIIFGKKYNNVGHDSIDEQDLDVVLSTPGRFVAISAQASDIPTLTREITAKMFTGFQPAWTDEEARKYTFMSAFSLKSIFAEDDFSKTFDEVRARIHHTFDEYRNVEQTDNDGVCEATVIIAGLPRPEIREIENEYEDVGGMGNGMNRSKRPKFMRKKKAKITDVKDEDGNTSHKKFDWV